MDPTNNPPSPPAPTKAGILALSRKLYGEVDRLRERAVGAWTILEALRDDRILWWADGEDREAAIANAYRQLQRFEELMGTKHV